MNDTVVCPACRRSLRVPDHLLGQLVKCPVCDQTFAAGAEPPPAPAAPSEEPRRRERPLSRNDEERPVRRRSLVKDDDDDRSRRRSDDKPDKVQTIAVLTLVGGVMSLLVSLGLMASCFGLLWPGTYYALVLGIMAIVKGSQLLGDRSGGEAPPSAVAVMQIINIINLDVVNLALGIVSLVFLNDPQVRNYYRR